MDFFGACTVRQADDLTRIFFLSLTFSLVCIVTFFLAAGSVDFSGATPAITHIPAKTSFTQEGGDLTVFTKVMSAGLNAINVSFKTVIKQ
jgi:hypothetical protein